jgi:pSer/pThr/pTyr-binding forkhead associated (FHA) protein
MIVCPNCKHENPQGANNCEACYTALPATKACPSCGASIQLDATFCGQCGHNLKLAESKLPILLHPPAVAAIDPVPVAVNTVDLPPTILTDPEADLFALPIPSIETPSSETAAPPITPIETPNIEASVPLISAPPINEPDNIIAPTVVPAAVEIPPVPTPEPAPAIEQPAIEQPSVSRQLLHLQTNTILEILPHLAVIHVGKPNETIAPDIDVSSFPCAEVVSRIHANIQVEDNNYYIEDAGSANGTYINHNVLAKGNRHLLRDGDRIGLGKGDLVTFIFQATTV